MFEHSNLDKLWFQFLTILKISKWFFHIFFWVLNACSHSPEIERQVGTSIKSNTYRIVLHSVEEEEMTSILLVYKTSESAHWLCNIQWTTITETLLINFWLPKTFKNLNMQFHFLFLDGGGTVSCSDSLLLLLNVHVLATWPFLCSCSDSPSLLIGLTGLELWSFLCLWLTAPSSAFCSFTALSPNLHPRKSSVGFSGKSVVGTVW